MLIPIIKESENKFEELGIVQAMNEYFTPEQMDYFKSHLASSQLALLEGQVKMYEGMKRVTQFEGEVYDPMLADAKCVAGFNSALILVIQSLKEYITYLKSMK